ncbi:nucleotidyl transferase AbiEii/AbiGii toxin family protein [Candidatus Peregrinibacteria bacterium]|nr:nucleotidyl transferase AbiEii/AbiGii toxin family protein [Candidatus Peregrinibacteria bacterium]
MALNLAFHRNILLQILKEIYTDTTLGPILGFKGGTAAHFFYDLSRFSVDLDFDLLDAAKENYVFEKIENILKNFGILKEKYKKKHTLFFILSYDKAAQNIKIEINRRSFASRYELKNYLGISMLLMVKEDMFAHKLIAMLERIKTANRDIFDVWFFFKNNWQINKEILEKRSGMSFQEYIAKCIEFVESRSNRDILAGMGELLNQKQKTWAKASLKSDTVFLLKARLESEHR